MALATAWPVAAEKKSDWERTIQFYGYCEVLPDRTKPQQAERSFTDWALKRGLACVQGENLVAFDPKLFNPKASFDRQRFGFLARYFRPRELTVLRLDMETAFSLRSLYVLEALKSYWMTEGVLRDNNGYVEVDRELLRLMGFSYLELMQALDGVVKKEYLNGILNGHKLVDATFTVEYSQYVVNFDILKERFLDGEFLIHAAGQPILLGEMGRQMGIESVDDLLPILKEAKRRYDLNIELSEEHVMFGPPSEASIEALIARERSHKERLQQTEVQLKDRFKTIKELLDRYTAREAKILNEIESLREEGRLVWLKAKVVATLDGQINNGVRRVSS